MRNSDPAPLVKSEQGAARRWMQAILLSPAVALSILFLFEDPMTVLGTNILAWALVIAYLCTGAAYFVVDWVRRRVKSAPTKGADAVERQRRRPRHASARRRLGMPSIPVDLAVAVTVVVGLFIAFVFLKQS